MDEDAVDSILQEVALSLPSVEDGSVLTEEVDGDGGEEEEVSVFSRANHFHSLGISETGPPLGSLSGAVGDSETQNRGVDKDKDVRVDCAILKENSTSVELRTRKEGEIETGEHPVPDPRGGDTEWDQFKSDFMQQLQGQGHEVDSSVPGVEAHLHLEALSDLLSKSGIIDSESTAPQPADVHNDRNGQSNKREKDSERGSAVSDDPQTASNTESDNNSILSTSLLSEIRMSAIDRALELVNVEGTRAVDNSGEDSRQPNPAWEESEGSSSDLMSQLVDIRNGIQLQPKEKRVIHRERPSEPAAIHSVVAETVRHNNSGRNESEKKTVYIDLRQPTPKSGPGQPQTQSESEESDDQVSWALKRREIKSALSPPSQQGERTTKKAGGSPNRAAPLPSAESPNSHQEPVVGPAQAWQTANSKKKNGHQRPMERSKGENGDNKKNDSRGLAVVGKSVPVECAQDVHLFDVESPDNSPPSGSSDSALQSSSCSSIQCEYPANSVNRVHADTQPVERHHTSGSFTLSSELSSFSEGEISPTKHVGPAVGLESAVSNRIGSSSNRNDEEKKTKSKRKRKNRGAKSGQQDEVSETQKSADSSPELGAKEEDKGEEARKVGTKKKEGGTKSKKKKKGDAKKKKPPFMRIRFDSLTTSSDEERGIDSPRLSRVEEVAEPLPEGKEESEERLRQRLEHRILSKKPPAMFETPATEPLFHKDVSFSPVLTHVYPSLSTDALLVIPLSSTHGLLSLPPSHPHLSPESHLHLHSLLLASLAVSAAHCTLSPPTAAYTPGKHGRGSSPLQGSKLPFRITALYQTVLDGQLSVLIGVSLPQGRKRSMSYPSIVHHGPRKSTRSTGAILSPLDTPRSPFAAELDGILCQMKLKDLLGDVMENSKRESTPEQTTGRDTEKVAVPLEIHNELQPLLDMSAQAFFSVHPDTDPLSTPTSFYWHSLYHFSCLPTREALCTPEVVQSTVCALPSHSLTNPSLVFHALCGAYDFGLSIAGVRLVYGEPCSPLDLPPASTTDDTIADLLMSLVLCLRGPDAVSRCMDLVGPEDHSLACVTDPLSLMARYGSPHHQPALCVRTPFRASAALARWFGGRGCLHTGTVLGMTDSRTRSERRKRQRVRFSESEFESEDNLPPPTPDITFPPLVANRSFLAVFPYQELLLVVSPLLPPCCYSSILATCGRLGFDIAGMKRLRLNSKRAATLDIPEAFASHFTPSSTPPSPDLAAFSDQHPLDVKPPLDIPPLPSLLLVVSRENALVLGCALKTTILSDLRSLLTLNHQLKDHVFLDHPLEALFHTVSYSPEKMKTLGGFSNVAVTSVSSLPQMAPEWEKEGEKYGEEIAFLAVTQASGLPRAVELLQLLSGVKTENKLNEPENGSREDSEIQDSATGDLGGFELLGIKLIPKLSRFHAKQLCPVHSTENSYQEAIELLSDSPALVLVLRGIACNSRLQQLLTPPHPSRSILSHRSLAHLSLLSSDTLSQAFHHVTLFFTDKELFCDPGNWPLLTAVPSAWARADVLNDLQKPPQSLYSVLVVLGAHWRLLVKVVDRLTRAGFQVAGLTMRQQEARKSEDTLTPDDTTRTKSPEVAVCVSRLNAVWYLNHELKPFLSSANNHNKLRCPSVFSDAVSLVKQYFPSGLCVETENTDYAVKSGLTDDFSGLRCALPVSPPTSPITETTCLILPSSHLSPPPTHPTPHYLQLLELAAQAGFSVTSIQLTHLSQTSLTALESLGIESKGLMSGPCLIVTLLRDNAVSCFHYILKSAASQQSGRGIGTAGVDLEEMLNGAVVPASTKTAAAIVEALLKEE